MQVLSSRVEEVEQHLQPGRAMAYMRILVRQYGGLQEEDIEDVVATAMLKILKAASHKEGEPVWSRAYLKRAVVTSFADWVFATRRHKTHQLSELIDSLHGSANHSIDGIETAILANQFRQTLSKDDRELFDAIELGSLNGMLDRDVASKLGMPASTFSSSKLSLLEKFRLFAENGKI